MAKDGKEIDWKVVGPRDERRLQRIKQIYAKGQLRTGDDLFNAALILQHSLRAEDYLLDHELSILAAVNGSRGACRWPSQAKTAS